MTCFGHRIFKQLWMCDCRRGEKKTFNKLLDSEMAGYYITLTFWKLKEVQTEINAEIRPSVCVYLCVCASTCLRVLLVWM